MRGYNFKARRRDEAARKCERCGKEYEPNSRNQKYCDECRGKRVK